MKFLEIPKVLTAVDSCLDSIIYEDLKVLKKIKEHVIANGGKRVRPLLHYYFVQLLGSPSKDWLDVAAVSELIHSASLLHDDVIDEAPVRRGLPTVGSKFGNKTAILAGDYLLACGIERLNTLNNPPLMKLYSKVLRDLSVSELIQMEWEKKPTITLKIYDSIIFGKTASLFGACTMSAGILSKLSQKECESLYEFGVLLGKLFQKKDDYLDYFQSIHQSGKEPLKDFKNGLFTYPILRLRQKAGKKKESSINQLVMNAEKSKKEESMVLQFLEEFKVREDLDKELSDEKNQLIRFLDRFPNSNAKKTIVDQINRFA